MRRTAQHGRIGSEARGPGRHFVLIAASVAILGCQLCLAATVQVHVRVNGINCTGQTRDWIVGKKARFDVVVTKNGVPTTPEAWSWTVPGKKIQGYTATTESATKHELTPADLEQAVVPVFWLNAGDGRVVSCTVTVDGQPYSAHGTFNVKRPTSTLTTSTGSVSVDDSRGSWWLEFGQDQSPGITFTKTCTEPAGFTGGSTQWWQVVDQTYWVKRLNDGSQYLLSGSNVLDTDIPYPAGNEDSPGVPLTANLTEVSGSDNFTMYLMYRPVDKPAGSDRIWVPLRKVSWYWDGQAVRDDPAWDADDLQSSGHSTNPASQDCTDPPEWDGNVTGLQWVPMP
jgi:hypothetical protein